MKKIQSHNSVFSKLIKSFLLLVILSLFTSCNAQMEIKPTVSAQDRSYLSSKLEWPEITQQTKPWTRWWWMGNTVDEKDLSIAMEAYQNTGLGGLEITPTYGVKGYEDQFIKYLEGCKE